MNKKTIGIYLAAQPSAGGIFQYSQSLIEALQSLDSNIFDIVFFIEDELWKKHLPSTAVIHYNPSVKIKRLLNRAISLFSFNLGNKYAKYFNSSIRSINRSGCNLVIFPSQDNVSYRIGISALTAIHDLMHRYEPHFEEYQGGEYEKRERHYKTVSENSKGILVDSDMGKKHVKESYETDLNKIFKLPFLPPFHLLSHTKIDVRKKYNIDTEFIFYPAQFWEHKNHINLIHAFKEVIKKNIDLQLVLVGAKKNNYSKIRKTIAELELDNHVAILGYIPDQDLYSLYKSALFMIFPSLIGPTNIPPMEAMLLKCPLIVSNAYAMPEQVGDAALLIDPKSQADIANKIEQLYYDSDLREQLVLNGEKRISKWQHSDFNAKFEEIIIELV